MDQVLFWVGVGFLSGSIPWALLVGKLYTRTDIRTVGDGNPGAANAWKVGGRLVGMLAMVLEVSKSLVPVYWSMQVLDMNWYQLTIVALSPIVGHGYSPFLAFRGGKALAASWGSWIAVTGGWGFPVSCVLLATIHAVQKTHAWTVSLCLVGLFIFFMAATPHPYIFSIWLGNMIIVLSKHRIELAKGLVFRDWVNNTVGRST